MRLFGLFHLVITAGLAGAFGFTLISDRPEHLFADLKREVRIALRLPKNWMPLPGPETAEGRQAVACPDPAQTLVIATGGQSNASNANSSRAVLSPGTPVFMWFEGQCYLGEDPVLGTTADGGSLWPVLGERLAAEIGTPVLFVHGAVGGTQYSDWLDERSGYYYALNYRIASARSAGYELDMILWHQGETDAATIRDAADAATMEAALRSLTTRLLEDNPETPLYLFQASKCIGSRRSSGVAVVLEVQARVASENDWIIKGMNTDLLDNDYRWDTCHFNSRGRDVIVDELVPQVTRLVDG